MTSDNYKTITAPAKGSYKDKGSKFLAYAFPVSSEEEIKTHIQQLKKDYFDARHHCYAYRLGLRGEQWRANDDGEPSSTGGKPILGQLLSRELTCILVVVVRYFGGIQLGVPGLINAYRSATCDALDKATVVEKTAMNHIAFRFPYALMNDIMRLVKEEQASILAQESALECHLTVAVPKSKTKHVANRLQKLSVTLDTHLTL
jgi:uncharacterized YigZ family protein